MIVGMTTVFAILMIVIYLGKGLIVLVNKYAPEEIIVKKTNDTTKAELLHRLPALRTRQPPQSYRL